MEDLHKFKIATSKVALQEQVVLAPYLDLGTHLEYETAMQPQRFRETPYSQELQA